MYPLKFNPILKQVLWGGDKIVPFKQLCESLSNVGESWEISSVPNNESVVANGFLKGKNLSELVRSYKEELVGESNYKRFGNTFPLLIKFIDAREDLSIQVHPDDILAKKRHNSMGKTEMWYVVNAEDHAKLRSGFSQEITPKEYKERIYNSTITEVLKEYSVNKGDVFFIPAGRIHSIGAGCFIAEIQQTSDVTYRIFDFNRKDSNGNVRELHTELAKDAINYEVLNDYKTHYEPVLNEPVELAACPYFTTTLYDLTEDINCDYSELDSFVIFMCLEGSCKMIDNQDNELDVRAGETILLPASLEGVQIIPDGYAKLLETYV